MGTCEDIGGNTKPHRSTWTPKRRAEELIRCDQEGDEEEEEDDFLVQQLKNNVTIRSNDGGDDQAGSSRLPLRPYAQDCTFFLKSGTCKFGFACKFNHPAKKPNQFWKDKSKDADSEDFKEQSRQTECRYYLTAGGCKYGLSCRYSHSKADSQFAHLDLNFLGLPIRSGEKECPFYMRNGSCGYGAHCRFHHPDPITGGISDIHNPNLSDESGEEFDHYLGKWNSESAPFHFPLTSQPAQTSKPSPVISDSSVYVDNEFTYPMSIVPQGAYQNHEHNGYQVPNYFQDRTQHFHLTPALNSSMEIAKLPMQFEEFPQRPGQPNCEYFMKTGGCKFKSACWYHHPKFQTFITNPLSDKGLPLRPGKKICRHYEKSGFCKYGPTCLFDHPVNHDSQLLPMSTY